MNWLVIINIKIIIYGPILHDFLFVGSDACRVRYTLLKHELSDSIVHLGDNAIFLEKFIELYQCNIWKSSYQLMSRENII